MVYNGIDNNAPVDAPDADDLSPPSTIQKLKSSAKSKTKHILNIDATESGDAKVEKTLSGAARKELESPAFNSAKFLKKSEPGPKGFRDRTSTAFKVTANAIVHPKDTIKSSSSRVTASHLAKSRPVTSKEADLEFLQAHDDLDEARERQAQDLFGDEIEAEEGNVAYQKSRIEGLELSRRNMRVAWVTGRHVQRVRVVPNLTQPTLPPPSYFEEEDDCGYTRFRWQDWLGYKVLSLTHQFTARYIDDFAQLPYDEDTLRLHLERVLVVSAPLQEIASSAMRLYTWEDPWRTGVCVLVYYFFWSISLMMPFFIGCLMYALIQNYFYPHTIANLRAAQARSSDHEATARKIDELMDRHGAQNWIEPFLQEVGPSLQAILSDTANTIEAMNNLYHFRNVSASMATFWLLASGLIFSLFADANLVISLFWAGLGGLFFFLWPIATLHPRYRLLVSPIKWLVWDVPTHAELCFQYLQERSNFVKEAIFAGRYKQRQKAEQIAIRHVYDSDDSFHSALDIQLDENKDILSFGCTFENRPGHFIISTNTVRFQSRIASDKHTFTHPLQNMIEISKQRTRSSLLTPIVKHSTGMDKLEIRFRRTGQVADLKGDVMEPQIVTLENMIGRDKAFNALIGFSGLRWQHVQQRSSGDVDWKGASHGE